MTYAKVIKQKGQRTEGGMMQVKKDAIHAMFSWNMTGYSVHAAM